MTVAGSQKLSVPLLNLCRQYDNIKEELDLAIQKVIKTQSFILGEEVRTLEHDIAQYCGTKYAVGVNSGTDALFLALKVLGIKEGDEVITVPFTFIATAEAITNVGAKPVFVDIDPKTFNMDPSAIEAKITKKTKAIIPVHLYGQCADMDSILDIARKHKLKVIEDTAQALGAVYKGTRKAASMGDAGCISFFPSKNLGGFGDGGMVVTNDKDIAEAIKLLRVHGSSVRYVHSAVGYNSRLDNLQAAVLVVKLRYLDKWIKGRQEKAKAINEAVSGIKELQTPYTAQYTNHTYHQYTLRIKSELRDGITEHMNAHGVESRVYYPIPLHLQECYMDLGYKKGDLPESEKAAFETFVLPVFPEMTSEEFSYMIDTLKGFFRKG